uniref:Uncharacterized protein n=1 Tax=Arundo donax TaxID=35708 RepID=A0A0A9D8P0_ARUDO
MADDGQMKGVEGAGDGEERDEDAREELELALSLGRRGWHLPPPPRQEPAPRSLSWTVAFPEWNPDAAGSSRAAERAPVGQPVPPLRFGGSLGCVILDSPRAEAQWEDGDEEDEDRDLQNKRLRVRGFGEGSPQHSGVNDTFFGSESSFFSHF